MAFHQKPFRSHAKLPAQSAHPRANLGRREHMFRNRCDDFNGLADRSTAPNEAQRQDDDCDGSQHWRTADHEGYDDRLPSDRMATRRLMPGSVFNARYDVVRMVGQGAMGAVYEAIDKETGRACALKLMSKDLSHEPRFIQRFQAESKVGQTIQGPHVANVFDAGFSVEDPAQPFFAMELLQGENLEQHLARHDGRPPHAFHLVRSICCAIANAHEANVVHRDLKPENLFLAAPPVEGGPPLLKVLDFGVAKIVRETTQGGTSPGLGAPLWTAPEQGKEGQIIKPSADVWALGLLAYRLLAGKIFWRNAHNKGTAFDLAVEMLRENLPRASERSRELGAVDLGPAFDWWFSRAVDRDPSKRFPTAGDAERELAPILDALEHAPVGTRLAPTSPLAEQVKPQRSPRIFFAMVGALLLFLGAAVLWFVFR